jgi:hypothetical protein
MNYTQRFNLMTLKSSAVETQVISSTIRDLTNFKIRTRINFTDLTVI